MRRTWPAAASRVIHSDVLPLRTASGEVLYDTVLVLSYEAAGRTYVSSIGSLHESTHYERKKRQADRFPAGSQTEVRYNPENPHQVQIQPGYNGHGNFWCAGTRVLAAEPARKDGFNERPRLDIRYQHACDGE